MVLVHPAFCSDEQQSDHCVVAGTIRILRFSVARQSCFMARCSPSVEGLQDVPEMSVMRLPIVAVLDPQLRRSTVFTCAAKGRNDEVPHLHGREFDHVRPARN